MHAARFADRRHAGRVLGAVCAARPAGPAPVVLGLPRGGVPVAAEVAQALGAPLDIFVVRKLGVPGHEELAMGAIASGGVRVVNDDVVRALAISTSVLAAATDAARRELAGKEAAYRGDRPPLALAGRPVVVVDDGLATGSTMQAAVTALRSCVPASITVAVPVAPAAALVPLWRLADDVVCVFAPDPFVAVGASYVDFSPTTDGEVAALLGAVP
ncbi:MAG TPA: phosphoribosyltransferase family protein [Acidimicrobiales bacterium]|nr:phosphoribosyltransferase family protein [Acidimicrobiales bacterium]